MPIVNYICPRLIPAVPFDHKYTSLQLCYTLESCLLYMPATHSLKNHHIKGLFLATLLNYRHYHVFQVSMSFMTVT